MALRVLTQVNYSAGENVEGDSGLHFIAGLIRSVILHDPEIHFYVLVPERHVDSWARELQGPNVTAIPVDLPPRLHGGDFRFDPAELYERFDFRRFDIDAVFVNRPESAMPLLNFLNRQMFHNVRCLSYVHWLDVRRPSTPKHELHLPALLATVSGLVSSSLAACNSEYGRSQINDVAGRWFNDTVRKELMVKLLVLPPGVNTKEFRAREMRPHRTPTRILVNHRVLKYTGVRSLLTRDLPKLWTRRKDFEVTVTNPTRVRLPREITDAPWLKVGPLGRYEYAEALSDYDVVLAPHRSTHWSMSSLEAIASGCVPLMNIESFFPELMDPILQRLEAAQRKQVEKRWFYYRGNFGTKLDALLDDLEGDLQLAAVVSEIARETYSWDGWAPVWAAAFRSLANQNPAMLPSTPSMNRILGALEKRGTMSKSEILRMMRWAPKQRALSWTAFRKTLLEYADEPADNCEAVFNWRNGHPEASSSAALAAAHEVL